MDKYTSASLNICLISREYPSETAWGGIGTYTYQLSQGLAEKGHNVHIVAQSLDFDKEYMDGKVFIHRVSDPRFIDIGFLLTESIIRLRYSYKVYKKTEEITRKYNIDIIEAPNFFAEPFFYSLFKKKPLVIRLHSPFYEIIKCYGWEKTFDRQLGCLLEDSSIMRSDLITSSTKSCARGIASRLGIDCSKITIIPLGFKDDSSVNLKVLNGSNLPQGLNVLFVGRLERRKGAHILMKAIPMILEEIPNVHFTFIGRDTFVDSKHMHFYGPKGRSFKEYLLRDFPKKHKNNLRFLGYVDSKELVFYFSSCDIFVAPSLFETFGLIYIEAMSYGKPVIGCNVGGVPEVIAEDAGILVAPKDYVALAKAVIYLLKNKDAREDMGRQAFKCFKTYFTREIMVENTVNAYREVLNR